MAKVYLWAFVPIFHFWVWPPSSRLGSLVSSVLVRFKTFLLFGSVMFYGECWSKWTYSKLHWQICHCYFHGFFLCCCFRHLTGAPFDPSSRQMISFRFLYVDEITSELRRRRQHSRKINEFVKRSKSKFPFFVNVSTTIKKNCEATSLVQFIIIQTITGREYNWIWV